MAKVKTEKPTALVKHKPSVKDKVAKKASKLKETIGEFYDKAALQRLDNIKNISQQVQCISRQ